MKNANLSLVIILENDQLNEMNSLCDYRFNIIIQGQENERKRCLHFIETNKKLNVVRGA